MRGIAWMAFDRDRYLDVRRPGWCEAERLGHVRAMRSPDGLVVCVHVDHGHHIIESLVVCRRDSGEQPGEGRNG
jgi:hypothetical protein